MCVGGVTRIHVCVHACVAERAVIPHDNNKRSSDHPQNKASVFIRIYLAR